MARIVLLALLALVCACGHPTSEEILAASDFTLAREHGAFESIRGLQTFAITVGSGPDLVLLHGNPASSYTWRKVITPLSKHHRVHAFDLPGFGLSDKPPDSPYTAGWLAGHVVAYLDAHAIDSATLVGNSMGGEIASEVAILFPRRVSALILIAASGLPAQPSAQEPLAIRLARMPLVGSLMAKMPARALIRASLRDAVFFPETITEADVAAYYLPLRTKGGMTAFLTRLGTTPVDRSELVTRIRAPTLIITGDTDRLVTPEVSRRYHEAIANSTLIELEKTGHLPQEERPARVVSEIESWLSGQPPGL